MLVLTRKEGEVIVIVEGDDSSAVRVKVIEVKGKQVRLGFEAPKTTSIYREEIYDVRKEKTEQSLSQSPEKGAELTDHLKKKS